MFSQTDYYSPSKAADGFYRTRLKALRQQRLQGSSGGGVQDSDSQGDRGLRKAIAAIVADPAVPKEDWLVEARAAGADHQVDYDVDDDWLRPRLDEAEQALSDDRGNAVRGGSTFSVRKVKDVMPGFFKEGMLHMLNAEQGAGKSTLMLGLFRALFWRANSLFPERRSELFYELASLFDCARHARNLVAAARELWFCNRYRSSERD